MGNITANTEVGMLFIDFERPKRLRLQGKATIDAADPLKALYKEADLIVRVEVSEIWVNCPRYIHRYKKVHPSGYVPRENAETPVAAWKRVDLMQDVLTKQDQEKAEQAGLISVEKYAEMIETGEA